MKNKKQKERAVKDKGDCAGGVRSSASQSNPIQSNPILPARLYKVDKYSLSRAQLKPLV